jgi:hypothetical protein
MNEHDHQADADAVRAIFRRAPKVRCPDALRDRILAAVDAEEKRTVVRPRTVRPRRAAFVPRWLWSAAAAAAILLAFLLPGRIHLPGQGESLSAAEIEATREDVEFAFSVISEAFGRSSAIVDEQIRENVIRPVFHPSASSPAKPPASPDERSSGLSLPPHGGALG